jgi:polyphenol oxidase
MNTPHPVPGPTDLRAPAETRCGSRGDRLRHGDWASELPWLVQGITSRDAGDLGLFTDSPSRVVQERWRTLLAESGLRSVAHARQVHGAAVRFHDALPPGWHLAPDADGHATGTPGLLLAVTVADCVPVYLVHPEVRAVALLHAGWRGTAAGVLEAGVATLADRLDLRAEGIRVHLGPAICGACYEVGPEVHEALGFSRPVGPRPVDLRAVLAARAEALGVPRESITVSGHCTRCGDSPFYSHRGGDPERQVAYLGVLARAPTSP